MRRAFLVLMGLCLASCGGGGGEPDPGPSAPGVLRLLALQGEPAPETAGLYAAFPTDPPMDVAPGGWAAFVASTTDPAVPEAAYLVEPDATIHLAWGVGDVVPDAGGGTISGVNSVRVTSQGLLLVHVSITGDAGLRTQGLLSARVTGGAVTDRNDVLYDQRDMTDVGLTGLLSNIDDTFTRLLNDGTVFADVDTSLGEEAVLRVLADGTDVSSLVQTDDALSGGDTFVSLQAFDVDAVGNRFTFLAERQDGSSGLYVGVVGIVLYSRLFEEGDALSEGVADDLPVLQPLAIDTTGRVLFKAVSDVPEDHLCVVASGFAPAFLAVEGDQDVWTEGLFEDLAWLNNQRGTTVPMFQADLGPNAQGVSFGIFAITDLAGDPTLAMWDGRDAPAGLGANLRFTSTFPGLAGAGRRDVSSGGALAFANVLNSGRPGAFWLFPGNLFTIAAGGLDIPGGGDTFGGLSTWRVTATTNVMLFRAPVTSAGSGIFRRGP